MPPGFLSVFEKLPVTDDVNFTEEQLTQFFTDENSGANILDQFAANRPQGTDAPSPALVVDQNNLTASN